ncbi:MAG: hypothetical protein CMN30_24445 [Sandaracinus sp.]|nr:hypothetical protein [Sandaracinus sp.]
MAQQDEQRETRVSEVNASQDEQDGWAQLLAVLDKVPFMAGLKRDIASLTRMIYRRRLGRVVAVGHVGAGRSQLLNALLGGHVLQVGDAADLEAGQWAWVDASGKKVAWMEVDANGEPLGQRTLRALDREPPDVILALVTPEQVAAGAGQVLEAVLRIQARQAKKPPRLIPLLTQVDRVAPADAAAPFPQAKRDAIRRAARALQRQLDEAGLTGDEVRAVATPSRDEQSLGVEPYGLLELRERIADEMPEQAQVETARALEAPRARRRVAQALVQSSSTLSITVALAPIPFSDLAVIAPLQGMMVTSIAYLSGRPWDRKTLAEWGASVGLVGGAGIGLRALTRQIVKFVPGAGSIVSASVAGAGTLGIGRSAIGYFLGDPQLPG